MNLNDITLRIRKNLLTVLSVSFTAVFITASPVTAFASTADTTVSGTTTADTSVGTSAKTDTYRLADINTQVQVSADLMAFTRNVTSADPNLSKIGSSSDELHVMFEQHGVYLECFPEDLSYELVVSGTPAPSGSKDFNTMTTEELTAGLAEYRSERENSELDTLFSAELYSSNGNHYYRTQMRTESDGTVVYVQRYYTVMLDNAISITLQTKAPSADATQDGVTAYTFASQQNLQLQSVVDSAQYEAMKSSITDSPIFTELMGYFVGLAITVGGLGLLLFIMIQSTKKSKKKY